MAERLRVVLDKIEGEGDTSDACPSCTESGDHHDWRSCLKRMICRRNWRVNGKRSPLGTHRTFGKDIRPLLVKIAVR